MPMTPNQIDSVDPELEKPRVPIILKDENGDESPDGLLPRSALSDDLQVIVPDWIPPPFADPIPYIITISWVLEGGSFTPVYKDTFDTPGEKVLKVPRDKLAHGIYALSYELNYGGNKKNSFDTRVTVDRLPPDDGQSPGALILLNVPGDVITDDYLTRFGEVRFQVPFYVDAKARDRAIYFLTDSDNPPDSEQEIREQEFSQPDIDQKQLIITIYEADIRARGHGPRYFYYKLRDWAGNIGPRATLLPVFVDLRPGPGNLKPPRVPLSIRGLIDREHAREGATNQKAVTVEIDPYDNPDASDELLIRWNGHDLAPLDVDPAAFPLTATVPWATLTADGLGPMDAHVDYRVSRGGIPTLPSPETTVPYNFTVAGQDHPDAPALLNTRLAKVEIYGAVSKELNKLLPDDYELPAEGQLALHDDPVPGEKVFLYWGAISTPVAEYEVQPGDTAGKIIFFSIPWAFIDLDKENPVLPVRYVTDNGVNQQLAPTTLVNVAIIIIRNLPEPTFPDGGRQGLLNCCANPRLWVHVKVHVKGNDAFDENDVVELHWQGCLGPNGTSPIAGAADSFPKTLSIDEARNGFDVLVTDYQKLIAPMVNNGSALCRYFLRKSNGGRGESRPDFVIINRTMPSGEVCGPDKDLCNE
ncbi:MULTISPECIES: hypothetical protein [Pseudomonas]|uniref:hypothetical protein n=1 Tax=Pseudomonas TaxID=286 RepID=UPI001D08B590|nr:MULTISPECIES: hypothetical protein [Pseudomonas]MCX4217088.1 hypothetical protein [Pseudomonas sp. MCal1]UIN52669.1 hypothetical protein LXN51_16835 [Pseudomonas kribbensis]